MRIIQNERPNSQQPDVLRLQDEKFIQQFELWGREEWCVEGEFAEPYLNFYVPTIFDVNRAFGLCVDQEKGEYTNVYLNWYPKSDKVELAVVHILDDEDRAYDVELTDKQAEELKKTFIENCMIAYGHTPQELWGSVAELSED